MHTSPALSRPRPRTRGAVLFAIVAGACAIVAAFVLAPVGAGGPSPTPAPPFVPTAQDGLIQDGEAVQVSHADHPAVSRLDPDLRRALGDASAAAAQDGVILEITSGWRSVAYQRWLLEDAEKTYGDPGTARRYVADPAQSRHVTGRAVDIGPVDAQSWLSTHGARFGLCQTYANEPWHFERAGEPGGGCPEMAPDAASVRGH